MDLIQEIRYSGICKCCLENDNLKNLWSEYCNDGETEIYGQMMAECFVLPWHQPEDPENNEQICEDCVSKLRSAFYFKKQVLTTEQELMQQFLDVPIPKCEQDSIESDVKEEYISDLSGAEDVQTDVPVENSYTVTYEYDPNRTEGELAFTAAQVTQDHQYTQYQDIEYLEHEEDKEVYTIDQGPEVPKRKWPKKKKKAEILKPYLNYTQEDLKNSIEAVLSKRMTKAEAAEAFNVPRRTIAGRIRRKLNEPENEQDKFKKLKEETQRKLINEIKKILIYTNATPFKSDAGSYYCIYCQGQILHFNDPDELRVHTKINHAEERTKSVEKFLRPYYRNEILRIDVKNLICTICCTMISDWKEMFIHLSETHDVKFELANIRVVPYILNVYNSTKETQCALCKDKFSHYKYLDSHMNSHYKTYMCDDCGECFLALGRLKKHIKTHKIDRKKCNVCDKFFDRERLLQRHYNFVHKKQELKYKCLFCNARFVKEYDRHLHVLKFHQEHVVYSVCEVCGKVFDWKPYYVAHLKRQHNKERSHKCSHCEKTFYTGNARKRHEESHFVQTKNICKICKKIYCTAHYLKQHYSKTHGIVFILESE